MKDNAIARRAPMSLKEKGQYALAFGIVAVMLFIVGFPVLLVAFFGALAYSIWRLLTAESRGDTRRIFEFYLSANEMLRKDERRWFGFELKDAITRGEAIVQTMTTPPPLVHFSLGALYHKIGDHSLADKHLSIVADAATCDELGIVFPTKELRDYVRVLRKIERSPAEAPLTSAAVRSLERLRRNQTKELLEECRARLAEAARATVPVLDEGSLSEVPSGKGHPNIYSDARETTVDERETEQRVEVTPVTNGQARSKAEKATDRNGRKTISEVLHDIYDSNA